MPPRVISQTRGRLRPAITSSIMYARKLDFFSSGFEFFEPGLLRTPSVFSNVRPICERAQQPIMIMIVRRRKFRTICDAIKYLARKGIFSFTYVETVVMSLERRESSLEACNLADLRDKYMCSYRQAPCALPRRLSQAMTPFLRHLRLSAQLRTNLFNYDFAKCILASYADETTASIYLRAVRLCASPPSLNCFFNRRFLPIFLRSSGVLEDNAFFRRAGASQFLRIISYISISAFKLLNVRAYASEMSKAVFAASEVEHRLQEICGLQNSISRLKGKSDEFIQGSEAFQREDYEVEASINVIQKQLQELRRQAAENEAVRLKDELCIEEELMTSEDRIAEYSKEYTQLAPQFAEQEQYLQRLIQQRLSVNATLQEQKQQTDSVKQNLTAQIKQFDAVLAAKDQAAASLAAETQRFQKLKERKLLQTKKSAEQQLKRLLAEMDSNLSVLREKIDFPAEQRNLRSLWTMVTGTLPLSGSCGLLDDINLEMVEESQLTDDKQMDVRIVLNRRYAYFTTNLERLNAALQRIEEFVARQLEEMQDRRTQQQQEMALLEDALEQLKRDTAENEAQEGAEGRWRLKRADGEIIKTPPETFIEPQLSAVAQAIVARYGEIEDIFNRISLRNERSRWAE